MIYDASITAGLAPRHARTSSGTTSFWCDGASDPTWDTLHEHLKTQVCVVGGGLAGMTTAYFLARGGRDVVVLDAGAGESRRSTGHLTVALDDRLAHIESLHGTDALRLVVRSHAAAIDTMEQVVGAEQIACDFERVKGYLLPADADGVAALSKELEAAQRAGVTDVHMMQAGTGADEGSVLCFPGQAQVNPLAYLQGLARAVRHRGGRIFRARVVDVGTGHEREVRTSSGFRVTCEHVVVATNTPIAERTLVHARQVPYRTYVIAALLPKGLVPHVLFWDTGAPYHYARVAATRDPRMEVLIVGGEDHRTGTPDDGEARFIRLEMWMRERFAGVGDVQWEWSGQVMQPVDCLGFLGRDRPDSDGSWMISGAGGNGMTYATLGGRLVADQILGGGEAWGRVYDPRRTSLRAVPALAREGLHNAAQYRTLVSPGDVASRREIAPGTGAVVRDGLTKTAVFRDPDGSTRELSAFCSHSGCVVQWNQTERSWDCPCHGSRYGVDGRVLCGPAVMPLEARSSSEIPLLHPLPV